MGTRKAIEAIQDDTMFILLKECGILDVEQKCNTIYLTSYDKKNKIHVNKTTFKARAETCNRIVDLLDNTKEQIK